MNNDLLELVAKQVHKLEGLRVFDEPDMKFIRLHAYAAQDENNNYRVCLTTEHVGNLFGVSPQTVRNWCRDDKIECWRSPEGWWDVPLISVYELKMTNRDFSEWLRLDIKKVDF